ncbi:MAG: hypothetical protein U0J70_03460 [Atopobiaceae bacterium]|jgi:hypothetical protein|nr:hypothetical protein [Atopobiaceae bacterium]
MAVELAALIPVIVVVSLVVFNLARFVSLCAAFDRISLDAIVSQGVSPTGEQTQMTAVNEVHDCIVSALGDKDECNVRVSCEPVSVLQGGSTLSLSPALTKFTCVLVYRPWPASFIIAGVPYDSPLALNHVRSLVVDRYSPGVVM